MTKPRLKNEGQAISRVWHCQLCRGEVPKGVSRKQHAKAHAKCETCLEAFPNPAALLAHQRSAAHCYCPGCDMHFRQRDLHVKHLRAVRAADERRRTEAAGADPNPHHHPAAPEPAKRRGHGEHECGRCGRDYPDAAMARYHCCDCDKVYRGEAGLNSHLACDPKHTADKSAAERAAMMRRHVCPVCLEAFQKLKALRGHIRAEHAVVDCPLGCSERFSTPQDMVSHWRHRRCVEDLHRRAAAGGASRVADMDDAQMQVDGQSDDAPQRWIIGLFEEAMRREREVDLIADIIQKLQLLPAEEPGDSGVGDAGTGDGGDAPQRAFDLFEHRDLIARAMALQQRMKHYAR